MSGVTVELPDPTIRLRGGPLCGYEEPMCGPSLPQVCTFPHPADPLSWSTETATLSYRQTGHVADDGAHIYEYQP